jgi:hypothetical protein
MRGLNAGLPVDRIARWKFENLRFQISIRSLRGFHNRQPGAPADWQPWPHDNQSCGIVLTSATLIFNGGPDY